MVKYHSREAGKEKAQCKTVSSYWKMLCTVQNKFQPMEMALQYALYFPDFWKLIIFMLSIFQEMKINSYLALPFSSQEIGIKPKK